MPLYAKSHSQGEYIFDHNWAHAWERAGGSYYPKLQAAVPFTPATGRRFLTRPGHEATGRAALLQGALDARRRHPASRACTSPSAPRTERAWGESVGLLARTTQQFHWLNRGYADFDAFLADLASRKRKAIRKERERRPGLRRRHRRADRRRARARALGRLLALLPGHRQPQMGPPLPDPRLLRPGAGDDARRRAARPRPPPRPLGRRRAQLHRPRRRSSAATGAAPRTIPSCTSSSATTRRSTGRSPTACPGSRPAPRASTSSPAATCPRRPTRCTGWPTPASPARWRNTSRPRRAPSTQEIEVLTAYGPFRRGSRSPSRTDRRCGGAAGRGRRAPPSSRRRGRRGSGRRRRGGSSVLRLDQADEDVGEEVEHQGAAERGERNAGEGDAAAPASPQLRGCWKAEPTAAAPSTATAERLKTPITSRIPLVPPHRPQPAVARPVHRPRPFAPVVSPDRAEVWHAAPITFPLT